ncbi:LTA synthase family protein [Paenibacillus sp. CAA11]|uniref:LTA synthase family protein n=1 Tax=Paenibacillus sp. CAA11 TaxID=1532905 RepID=UPI001F28B5DD|nr:LTA synthase family protein [Paenibacillus sp. CAA11]
MWDRLATDGLAILVIMCLIELIVPSRAKGPVMWGFNLVFSLMLFASTLYYAHFGSVPTYTALRELHQVPQIKGSVESLIEPEYFLFFIDLLVLAILWGVTLSKPKSMRLGRRPVWKIGVAAAGVVSLILSGWYIHNGGKIENEIVQAENLGFLDYQVAAVLKENRQNDEITDGNLGKTKSEVKKLQATFAYKDASSGKGNLQYFGAAKGKNLIIIQMEAFQNFPLHLSLNGQELTPVLNKLAAEGLYFPNFYQQIGQGNTSDAEFMSNTSIYPTGTIAMSTGYGDRELPSLPRLLEKYNYESSTFHVNDVSFWDRSKMYPALNFTHYYDKPSYTNDHFNAFGASDEELYRVGVEKLSELHKQNKPFYAQFVTASSHAPFNVPKDRQRITLPDSLQGTELGDYLTAINYTDYAIGTLVERLKQNGMWDDTALVAYGDHFGILPKLASEEFISSELGIKYNDQVSRYNIPLLIHIPGQSSGKVVERVGGQLDILPTVANIMGVSLAKEGFTAFGHDLLNVDHNIFGMRYYLPTGSFFNDDVLFVPGKGFDDGTAISLKTYEPVTDITKYRADYDYILKLMKLSDAYVKQLPKRGP